MTPKPKPMPMPNADASRPLRVCVRVTVARVLDGRARSHSRAFTRAARDPRVVVVVVVVVAV
jgi:hypothetical protein